MRGSIALEFLLVVLAIVMYTGFAVKSAEVLALQSAEDISTLARLRTAMNKIYNAAVFLSAGSDGSSALIYVYLPQDANITFAVGSNVVEGDVLLDGNFTALPNCSAHGDRTLCRMRETLPLAISTVTGSFSPGAVNPVLLSRVSGKIEVKIG